jgi:hypothetical protein
MWTIPSISTYEVKRGIENTIARWDDLRKEMFAVRDSYDWTNVLKHLSKNYEAVLKFHHLNSDKIREKYFDTFFNTVKL